MIEASQLKHDYARGLIGSDGGPSWDDFREGDHLWQGRITYGAIDGQTIHGSHTWSGGTIYGKKNYHRWSGGTILGGPLVHDKPLQYTIAAGIHTCTNETHSLALLQDLIPTLAASIQSKTSCSQSRD